MTPLQRRPALRRLLALAWCMSVLSEAARAEEEGRELTPAWRGFVADAAAALEGFAETGELDGLI